MKKILVILLSFLLVGCSVNNGPKEIKISRVIGLPIKEALAKLEDDGVKKISTNVEEYQMFEESKLIVVSQNISGNHQNDEEVILGVRPLHKVTISIYYDDTSEKDYDIRTLINGETILVLKKGHEYKYSTEALDVLYLSFYDNDNHSNARCIGVGVRGEVIWEIVLRADESIEIKREYIEKYIKS